MSKSRLQLMGLGISWVFHTVDEDFDRCGTSKLEHSWQLPRLIKSLFHLLYIYISFYSININTPGESMDGVHFHPSQWNATISDNSRLQLAVETVAWLFIAFLDHARQLLVDK